MNQLDFCKQEIIKYSHLSYARGLVTAAGGNISMRAGDQAVITASNVSLRDVTEENLIVCDLNGNVLDAPAGQIPSKETIMHLKIFQNRSDIDSVIHVHPPYCIGFSIQNRSIPICTVSAQMKVIDVPMAPCEKPGSKELSDSIEALLKKMPENLHAILLKNHGTIVFEKGMGNCFNTTELVEDTAHIAYISEHINPAVK